MGRKNNDTLAEDAAVAVLPYTACPMAFLALVMQCEGAKPRTRIDAAVALLPYCHRQGGLRK